MGDRFGSPLYLLARDIVQELNHELDFYPNLKGVSESARAKIKISALSFYRDNVWDFSTEYPSLRSRDVVLKFSQIHFGDGSDITMPGYENYLNSVKEYCYSLLVDPPSTYPKWSTICVAMNKGVRTLLRFMRESGIVRFSDVFDIDFQGFQDWVAESENKYGELITNRTLNSRIYGLSWLYEQSGKLTDGLVAWPFGDSRSETEWAKDRAQKKLPRKYQTTPEMPDSVAKKLILCAIDDLSIAEKLQDLREKRKEYKYRKSVSRKLLPSGEYRYSVEVLNPFPWHRYGVSSASQVKTLESRLLIAGYILISMFSGMRFHEVAHIKFGRINNWSVRQVSVDGGVRDFYFLVSKTNKLQHDATHYLWQTIPFVERVLDALEQGLAHRYTRGNSFLFSGYVNNGERIALSTINCALKKYAEFHHVEFNGEVWSVATHQFRKKFSRLMIRSGLGLVALQDQLKHFDIQMTKNYGDLNLYSELQQEKFTLSREKYDEIMLTQVPIIGGGADEVEGYRKAFMGMPADDRERLLDNLSKKALIEQMDDGLCMFRAKKALCGGDSANCRPADCNNSIIPAEGMRRTLTWRKSENKRMRDFFSGQPLKVAHLDDRISEIDKLLSQMDSLDCE
jgi:integrase